MSNATLAQEILDEIEKNPEAHRQSFWFHKDSEEKTITLFPSEPVTCGTTLCVAGWAVHLRGYLLTSYRNGITTATLPFGPQRQVPDLAQELLDLSEMDAYILFNHTVQEEAVTALQQIVNGKEHIEWLAVFDNDEDYVEGIMSEFYRDLPHYAYDYEN